VLLFDDPGDELLRVAGALGGDEDLGPPPDLLVGEAAGRQASAGLVGEEAGPLLVGGIGHPLLHAGVGRFLGAKVFHGADTTRRRRPGATSLHFASVAADDRNRWLAEAGGRSRTYDERWEELAAAGRPVHGEVDFVERLRPRSVLDAGCGTGRVAVELAARGADVVGVDVDPSMLDVARGKRPDLTWVLGDLASVDLGRIFDVVVLAGNVMIFLAPGSEAAVVANLARHVAPGGAVVAGFSLEPGRLDVSAYDTVAASAGLSLVERWATWDRDPFAGGNYAVSVHRRPPGDKA